MDTEIKPEEVLYRAVFPSPAIFWDEELGRYSSAIFKDSKGVSVDRDYNRTDNDICDEFKSRFPNKKLEAVVSIGADFCYDLPTHLEYKPEPDNEYHSEIYDSKTKITISKPKLRKLAEKCNVINLKVK